MNVVGRIGAAFALFFVGVLVMPFVPFALAYMAMQGDFTDR